RAVFFRSRLRPPGARRDRARVRPGAGRGCARRSPPRCRRSASRPWRSSLPAFARYGGSALPFRRNRGRSSPGEALAVSGPAGVTALVLAETVSGGLVLLFLTPLWREVRRGFFTLTGSVLLVLSFATWGAAAAGSVPGSEAGEW